MPMINAGCEPGACIVNDAWHCDRCGAKFKGPAHYPNEPGFTESAINWRRRNPICTHPNRFNGPKHDAQRDALGYAFDYYVVSGYYSHQRVEAEIRHDETDAELMLMYMRVRPHYNAKRADYAAYGWAGLPPFHEWAAAWGREILKEADTLESMGKRHNCIPLRQR